MLKFKLLLKFVTGFVLAVSFISSVGADKGDFFSIIKMINSGYQVVEEVRSR